MSDNPSFTFKTSLLLSYIYVMFVHVDVQSYSNLRFLLVFLYYILPIHIVTFCIRLYFSEVTCNVILLLFIARVSILFTGSYCCTNSGCYLLHVYLFYLQVPIVVPILVVIYCTCIYFIYRFL
jgi:hypothetical protein